MAYQEYGEGAAPQETPQPASTPQPTSGESFPDKIRRIAKEQGWSEDFDRFDDATLNAWSKYWDEGKQRFRSEHAPQGAGDWAYVEKPSESVKDPTTGNEYGPWGNQSGHNYGSGGMGGGGGIGDFLTNSGGGGGGGFGGPGGAPVFTPPDPNSIYSDPGYKFRLGEGTKAIEGSAAAKGLLRSGGTLKDLMGYGSDLASQEYGNMFNRGLQEWQTRYQPWQTQGGWDLSKWTTGQNAALSKYLQREGNIYGLLNPSMPSY